MAAASRGPDPSGMQITEGSGLLDYDLAPASAAIQPLAMAVQTTVCADTVRDATGSVEVDRSLHLQASTLIAPPSHASRWLRVPAEESRMLDLDEVL
jgi:hypothetical protein